MYMIGRRNGGPPKACRLYEWHSPLLVAAGTNWSCDYQRQDWFVSLLCVDSSDDTGAAEGRSLETLDFTLSGKVADVGD